MKFYLRNILTLALFIGGAFSMSAQTSATKACIKTDAKAVHCKPAQCTPEMCAAMVAAGLCTKEEAAACNARYKASKVKVASVKLERTTLAAEPVVESTEVQQDVNVKAKVKKCEKVCAKSCKKTD